MSLFNFRLVLAGAALALAGGVIGTGCGGTDTSTVQGFCTALAQSDCSPAIVQSCYGSSEASLQADTDRCIQARSGLATCNPRNLPYHPDFADACIAQHQQIFSASTIDLESWKTVAEACLPALNRGGAQGSTCTEDSDCDVGYSGLRCLVRVGGKGTCEVPRAVMGGESCKAADAQCPDAQYCSETFNCISMPEKGDACGAGQPCGAGFQCAADTKICVNQLPNGSECARDSECQGGFCLDTASGKQCAASYVFAFGASTCSAVTR